MTNRSGRRRSFLLACAALALAGCGPKEAATSGSAPTGSPAPKSNASGGKKPKVALVMKSLANEFFSTMQKGAEKHQTANADKYDLVSNGIKDELDVSKQQQIIEQMISDQVSAIVVAPADSKAIVPICKKAQEAGITVINIDNKFDPGVLKERGVVIPFVGPDNRKGAKLAGDYLAKKLKAGDKVAIIEGLPTAFNGQQRKLGFEDAMNAGGLKIVASQAANWESDQANKIASAILSANPDIKALLCANDSMALGAVTALKAIGKAKQILVVGFDNISAIQQLIKEGTVLCSVEQHADQLAVFGIEAALKLIQTKSPPADVETAVDLVTAETLK